jgi:hypothetical protein
MRVIRGGGGKETKDTDFKQYYTNNYANNFSNNYASNPGQNFFFAKMLGNQTIKENPLQTKKSLNELKIQKYQQELKYLDNDELNNSRESDLYSIDQTYDAKSLKDKGRKK